MAADSFVSSELNFIAVDYHIDKEMIKSGMALTLIDIWWSACPLSSSITLFKNNINSLTVISSQLIRALTVRLRFLIKSPDNFNDQQNSEYDSIKIYYFQWIAWL